MSDMQLDQIVLTAFQVLLTGEKDRVNALLDNMSRDDVWYCRERAEEFYSAAAYAFEQKED